MNEQRNLFMAIVLSLLILVGFEYFFSPPPPIRDTTVSQEEGDRDMAPEAPVLESGGGDITPVPSSVQPTTSLTEKSKHFSVTREKALSESGRVRIETSQLVGSLALTGARIDDLILIKYREALSQESPSIHLLSPPGGPNAYFARHGWWTAGPKGGGVVPDGKTVWRLSGGKVLSPGSPVTLSWDNGQGLVFSKTFEVDDNFMFTVIQKVENRGQKEVSLYPYGLISRAGTPSTLGFYILHEGPLGVFDGTLKEVDYDELQEDHKISQTTTGGWLGITDKYWLVALAPGQGNPVDTNFKYTNVNGQDRYQTDYLGRKYVLAPGSNAEVSSNFFAGAKVVELLDTYATTYGIDRFDLSVDFGWFYFLTKPIFYALNFFNQIFGNFGLGILALTVAFRLLMYPLANKSFRSMNAMKKLHPRITELRERFEQDKARMNQEMMALYKREKVNPAGGCLPMLVQIPIFFALYKVLFVSIEMRQAPFYGWITDLSAPDPTSIFNLFGLLPFDPPSFLHIGVWPILMGLTMYLQQKLNPPPADPIQAKIFQFLPLIFTALLANFPAGLVIYWAWNNVLSIGQQWFIMRKMDAPAEKN
ncbi:MAG: membrane protein insertase YidC [Alphaproteobacteria bacterium]|nr:membrane protein insertase YidC [Alphaproteobacteria bacterium]